MCLDLACGRGAVRGKRLPGGSSSGSGSLGGARLCRFSAAAGAAGAASAADARFRRRAVTGEGGAIGEMDPDALGAARAVTVRVLLDVLVRGGVATRVVGDGDALEVGRGGAVGEVGNAARPVGGAWVAALVAADPGADLDAHRALRVAVGDVAAAQRAMEGAVDVELDALRRPVDRVLVARAREVGDGQQAEQVVLGLVAARKRVGLHVRIVGADGLEVNLVEVVGQQHGAGDDALAGRGLQLDLETAKEDGPLGLERGRLERRVHGAHGALWAVGDGLAYEMLKGIARALGKVAADALFADGGIGGTVWTETKAVLVVMYMATGGGCVLAQRITPRTLLQRAAQGRRLRRNG